MDMDNVCKIYGSVQLESGVTKSFSVVLTPGSNEAFVKVTSVVIEEAIKLAQADWEAR